jgi:Ca2+-binding EF-hand superfamily protein
MKQTDVNASGGIDRKEFMEVLLPQMKMEMLTFNTNFEELRRLFKEFDSDQSNYLSKEELRAALVTLNITLTDIQMEDLMKEIDLDSN